MKFTCIYYLLSDGKDSDHFFNISTCSLVGIVSGFFYQAALLLISKIPDLVQEDLEGLGKKPEIRESTKLLH